MKLRTFAFLTLLLLATVPIVPVAVANHSTWTLVNLQTGLDQDTQLKSAAFGTASWYGYSQQPGTDFIVRGPGGEVTVTSTGAVGQENDILALSATQVRACYVEEAATDNIFFIGSNTAGASWIAPSAVTVQADANDLDNCEIAALSDASYLLAYFDHTATAVVVEKSTDSGATWPTTVTADTTDPKTDGGVESSLYLDIAAKNATVAVLTFIDTSNNLRACNTSDAGETWACGTIAGQVVAAGTVNIEYAHDNRFLVNTFDGTTVRLCRNDQNGAAGSWECFQVDTPAGSVGGFPGSDVVVYDTDQYGVAYNFDTDASLQDNPVLYSETDDGGLSWSTPEDAATMLTPGGSICDDQANGVQMVVWPPTIVQTTSEVEVGFIYIPTTTTGRCLDVTTSAFGGITAAATASFTDLVGFDVDPLGSTVIVRTDSGAFVRTRSALTLTGGGNQDTDCAKVDSVFVAYDGVLVGFVDCDALADPTDLWIRTSSMGVPDMENDFGCGDGVFVCDTEIALDGFSQVGGDDSTQLGQVKDFPINYSSNRVLLGLDNRQIAWGFVGAGTGDNIGKVGVNAYTNREADTDIRNTEEVVAASTNVDDFCIGIDDDQYYMAVVDESSLTQVYPITFNERALFTQEGLEAVFGSPAVYGADLGLAAGVACGGVNVIVQNSQGVSIVDRSSGTVVTEFSATISQQRGVALSDRFTIGSNSTVRQFAAFVDASTIRVVDALTGAELGSITVPSGSFHSMKMDRTAQNLWVATDTQVARYSIRNVTTIVVVSPQSGTIIDPGTGTGDGGLFDGSGATIGTAFGVGAFGGNLFLGAVLMGIVAYGVGTGYGNVIDGNTMQPRALRVNPWAAAVGASVGFLMAWGFGFFSTAVVFSMVVLVVLIVGVRLIANRG